MRVWGNDLPDYIRALLLLLGMSFYWVWAISGLFSTLVWYGPEGSMWPWVVLSNAATLAALFFAAKWFAPFIERPLFVALAGIVTSAGIVCATLCYNIESLSFLALPGGLLTGIGSAPLILLWREASDLIASKTAERLFVAASVICATFFYLLFITLPFVVALVICSAAPIAAALCFFLSYDFPATQQKKTDEADVPGIAVPSSAIPPLLLVLCAVLALSQGVFKTPYLLPYKADAAWPLVVSCAMLLTIAVVFADALLSKKAPQNIISRVFLPTFVIAFSGAAFLAGGNVQIGGGCIFAAHFLFLIYTYSEIGSLSSRWRGVQVLAVGLGVIDGGFFVGMMAGFALDDICEPWILGAVLTFAAVVTLAARIRWSREADRFHHASSTFAQRFDQSNEGIAASTDMVDSISRQSARIAEAFALSAREGEILTQLVCGRTAKTIAADMFISYNTVKTHMNHIYRKTGVHTREELIALVAKGRDAESLDSDG